MKYRILPIFIHAGEVFVRGANSNQPIGYVFRNVYGLWSARDIKGDDHGNRYLDQWCAAAQLQLGLKVGIEVRP